MARAWAGRWGEGLGAAGVTGDGAAATSWAGHRPGCASVGARGGPTIGRGSRLWTWDRSGAASNVGPPRPLPPACAGLRQGQGRLPERFKRRSGEETIGPARRDPTPALAGSGPSCMPASCGFPGHNLGSWRAQAARFASASASAPASAPAAGGGAPGPSGRPPLPRASLDRSPPSSARRRSCFDVCEWRSHPPSTRPRRTVPWRSAGQTAPPRAPVTPLGRPRRDGARQSGRRSRRGRPDGLLLE